MVEDNDKKPEKAKDPYHMTGEEIERQAAEEKKRRRSIGEGVLDAVVDIVSEVLEEILS